MIQLPTLRVVIISTLWLLSLWALHEYDMRVCRPLPLDMTYEIGS